MRYIVGKVKDSAGQRKWAVQDTWTGQWTFSKFYGKKSAMTRARKMNGYYTQAKYSPVEVIRRALVKLRVSKSRQIIDIFKSK